MRLKEFLSEKGNRQKFAFLAVKDMMQGLKPEKVEIIKKDEKLRVKMPDRKQSSTTTSSIGLEFEVDVEAKN